MQVTYLWQTIVFAVFMTVFAVSGAVLGLSLFRLNEISLQIFLYWAWGNFLSAWSECGQGRRAARNLRLERDRPPAGLWVSATARRTRVAVMGLFIWLFITGFVASWVMRQFIEQGPSAAVSVFQASPDGRLAPRAGADRFSSGTEAAEGACPVQRLLLATRCSSCPPSASTASSTS